MRAPTACRPSLADALAVFGDRQAALANDLTKLYEEVVRGPLSQLAEHIQARGARGEYILVIAGAERS